MSAADAHTRLVVFSDDWGRHPSSCQHLIGQLVERYPVLWVNTIGTRRPRLSREDAGKVLRRLGQWLRPSPEPGGEQADPVTVISPRMWPGFRRRWQRRFNAKRISRAVNRALGPRRGGERRVALTTLPITADVVGRVDVDRWVYYCVDDFSVWPGLDGQVMLEMERLLVDRVDAHVAVSDTLVDRLAQRGAAPTLLTHGIDLEHWSSTPAAPRREALPAWWPDSAGAGPVLLFWGLIDARLNVEWCRAVAGTDFGDRPATLVLVGPRQSPDAQLDALAHVVMPGAVAYEDLPALAAAADVLVMPYRDLPVTRAMQPLKFKEYLATSKAVVASRLPAVVPWADAADLVETAEAFTEAVGRRIGGAPTEQLEARRRLADETWQAKAESLLAVLLAR